MLGAASPLVPDVRAVEPVVDVGYAKFQCAVTKKALDVTTWEGIQFAAPPVGDLHFAAPTDPVQTGVVDATIHGPTCPLQRTGDWTVSGPKRSLHGGRLLLYLSVTAPRKAPRSAKLPVVAFIQGRGFGSYLNATSTPARSLPMATSLSCNSITVWSCTVLYRARRFAVAASLTPVRRLRALEWFQEHIRHFWGDPERVIVDGVSAGGFAVGILMAADTGKKRPVAGGIAESGGWVTMRTMEQR